MYDEELDLTILNKYFGRHELAAPDGSFKLAPGFAQKLYDLREACAFPFVINQSGVHFYRGCRTYKDIAIMKSMGLPVADNSFHLIGNRKYGTDTCAVDIGVKNNVDKAKLVKAALNMGWSVRAGKGFIHVDRRSDYTNLPQDFDDY